MSSEGAPRLGRTTATLATGIGVSGVLTYGYFAVASHELGPDQYGSLVLLWSALFVCVVTLYRPVEQLISRSIAEHDELGVPSTRALRSAAGIQIALAAAFVAAALLLRGLIEDDLLSGDGTLYAVFVIAAPAYAGSFFARGYLAGHGRFGLYGAMLLLESGTRLAVAALILVGLASGEAAFAIGIALAPLTSLMVVPVLLRAGGQPGAAAAWLGDGPWLSSAPDASLASGGQFVGAAFLIMLSEQVLLNAGVLVVGAGDRAAAAGLIFNILLLARAPQVLFGAVTTILLPRLSRLRARGREGPAFGSSVRDTIVSVWAFTAATATVIAVAGPQLMELAFGDDYSYERADLLIVAAGMGFHLSSLTLTQATLACGEGARAAWRWVICALVFVGLSLLPTFEAVRQVEIAYLVATALLAALLSRAR